MDKYAKSLLNYLVTHGGCENSINFNEDLDNLASALQVNSESLRATVRFLHDNGYIDYQKYYGSDKNASFSLSHKGQNWKYFRRRDILNYFADKWIDFFASIISVGSLIVSIIALLN